MIQKISRLDKLLSTKTKTIVLVLAIFVLLSIVFVTLRYFDTKTFIKNSQDFYAERVKSVYNASISQTSVFYTNRGFANLNSFGIMQALNLHDAKKLKSLSLQRWEVLRHENIYLKNFAFYDEDGKLLCFLGKSPALKKLPLKVRLRQIANGFWFEKELSFKIFVPSEQKGYLVFTLDPKYFLSQIQKLTGFQGFIHLQKNQVIHLLSPKKKEQFDFITYLHSPSHNLQKDKRLLVNNELYTIHSLKSKAFGKEQNFQTLFFQNITIGQKRLYNAIYESIFIVLFLCAIAILILNYGFDVLIKRLEESNKKLSEKEEKLRSLNANLEVRVEEETQRRMANEEVAQEKERMLVHQNKLASMGEMIGNIAHQWRQPLTQLSGILIGLELFFEKGKLSKERLEKKIQEAQEQIAYMSNTIDDFRNFFASGKEKTNFSIQDCVEKVLSLIHASLKNNNIDYALHVKENSTVFGYENEISQVLLNILSNAKDALLQREISPSLIQITISKEEEFTLIQIEDNAGGIEVEPIEKIFEPYFSTKHASSGTGIGLYMSKTIIEKNSQGKLCVKNGPKGAIFSLYI